jgi:hypothetical protein
MSGCGGGTASLAPIATTAADSSRARSASWVSPEAAKLPTLLYVANESSVNIYAYANGVAGKLVGQILGLDSAEGMCTDKAGDVWITQYEPHLITEYAHVGKTPITTIHRAKGSPTGCAVNPSSGDLAVTYNHPNAHAGELFALVYIYPHGEEPGAKPYTNSTGLTFAYFLAYDDNGNLYMDGLGCYYGSCDPSNIAVLMLLKPGASVFNPVAISGANIRSPRGLSWIKPTLLIGDSAYGNTNTSDGYKLLVTKNEAKVVQTIPYSHTGEFWGSTVRAGNVIVPDQTNSVVRTYSLADGSLLSTLKHDLKHPFSAVISQVGK